MAWALTVDTPKTFSDLYDKALKYAKAEEVFKARYPGSVPNAPTGGHRVKKEHRPPYKPALPKSKDYDEERRRDLIRSPIKIRTGGRPGKGEGRWREGEDKVGKKASPEWQEAPVYYTLLSLPREQIFQREKYRGCLESPHR